jgi:hypothetical protein
MAKEPAKSTDQIEKLLEERRTVEQWLERLSSAADQAPSHVKERVESDYRKRLAEVVEQLQSHRDGISEALERHRAVRKDLSEQETDAQERLAECELRHSVGEFDDDKWSEMKGGIQESLDKIKGEFESVDGEVHKLEEVMGLIEEQQEPSGADELEALIAAPAEIEEVEDEPETSLPDQEQPAPATGEGRLASPSATFDELEFIRSVTEDGSRKPRPARGSGEVSRPPEAIEEPSLVERAPSVGAEGVTSLPEGDTQPKKAAAKTLKCTECGTMNLPTEWYCERCGAELAAL